MLEAWGFQQERGRRSKFRLLRVLRPFDKQELVMRNHGPKGTCLRKTTKLITEEELVKIPLTLVCGVSMTRIAFDFTYL